MVVLFRLQTLWLDNRYITVVLFRPQTLWLDNRDKLFLVFFQDVLRLEYTNQLGHAHFFGRNEIFLTYIILTFLSS